jgi:hypothetical protein
MTRISVIFVCTCILYPACFGLARPVEAAGKVTLNLDSMGTRPNDPTVNSRLAFQRAFAKLRKAGGGLLSIPAGDYYLDFPDIAQDVDPKDPRNAPLIQEKGLKRDKLIIVPPSVNIQGTLGENGGLTRIHWIATGFPIFSFVASDLSGIRDIDFVFDGLQPQFFPWSQERFIEEVGYKSRWLGGPYEISTVIYAIGSSDLRLENLSFRAGRNPADNEHTIAFGIVLKGTTPIPQPGAELMMALPLRLRIPGGGLSGCASDNVLRSLKFQDFVMGILASGQCNLILEHIEGNYRGSWYRSFNPSGETGPELKNLGPPGHLIYLTFQYVYDVERSQDAQSGRQVFHGTIRNRNIVLRNITEGSNTLSNFNSLGTLALKNIDHGIVANVVSQHPAGLIQSMIDAHDLDLESLRWSSDRDICDEPHRTGCENLAITLEPGPASTDDEFNSRVRFKNLTLISPNHPVSFRISQENDSGALSRDITVDSLTIECDPRFGRNRDNPKGIITVRSLSSHFTNVRYHPLFHPNSGTEHEKYSVLIQSRSKDTTIEMTLETDTANNAPFSKCVIENRQDQVQSRGPDDNNCQIALKAIPR